MFVSRKEWEEMQERIEKLEQKQCALACKLDFETTIKTECTGFIGSARFTTEAVVPLKHAIKLILKHLNLKIDAEPAKKAEFKLVVNDPDK